MKNALKVFRRDLKAMIKNPITMIIISGLCIIPSLYSFLNVIGCWNAYQNTSTIPIAVVNEDQGASISGKNLNIGDNVVDNLKTSNTIDWKFVSAKEADIGLASGKYFSELLIPADFSKDLGTLATNNPVKPELIYKVNTKAGPVANKITEVAQQTLLTQIQSSVMSTITSQGFGVLNKFGNEASSKKNEIIELKSAIIDLNDNMGLVIDNLNKASESSKTLNGYIDSLKTIMPTFNNSLSQIETNTKNIGQVMSSTKSILNQSLNAMNLNLTSSESIVNNMKNMAMSLTAGSNVNSMINNILSDVNIVKSNIDTNLKFLNSINKGINNSNINALIQNLNGINNLLNEQSNNIKNTINSGNNLSESNMKLIQNAANSIVSSMNTIKDSYSNGGNEAINNITNGLINATNSADSLISETENLNGSIQNLLNNASNGANLTTTSSAQLVQYLNQYKGLISQLSDKLKGISDDNINQLIAVLEGNPVVMGDFATLPFNFEQQSIYPVANYGSGMTPVYSVLAFWVGMLVSGALLKTAPPEIEEFEEMSIREKHYGKMMTYILIAIIQSLIITIGAKFLVGVQVVNLPLFILGSLVTSITFAIIVYTCLSMFGHLGDAICIVLMVVQLSGTGGTYPVQAMPAFFRAVEPFLPFPYGVDLMREAIGGPYWANAIKDIIALCVFAGVFLLIGYFFKPRLSGMVKKMDEVFEESGLAEE
ncbi:YhgE/Pip domain-containing protein [uncultured Clostridium sp.]|uniref:YhgE/Pip domain-containing protein n=1 Tax=uncultured Clostridium sp. TaxID=59620 RepID=UPI002608C5A3|nr:YhgE/Pip domain-containing protein [uncultured Clostridium sp.]